MESTPSYFGVQVAVAFYLINLSEFQPQTSLVLARDCVVGILLGLLVMWLLFDQLWGAAAAVEMKKTFISNLRLIAKSMREPVSENPKTAIARSLARRETIKANRDNVRAPADGVLFEFGLSATRKLYGTTDGMNGDASPQEEDLAGAYAQLEQAAMGDFAKGTTRPGATDSVISTSLAQDRGSGSPLQKGT